MLINMDLEKSDLFRKAYGLDHEKGDLIIRYNNDLYYLNGSPGIMSCLRWGGHIQSELE